MLQPPIISIIIPTYNRAHLIGRAIESVRRQYFQDWELIVIDDGSTDDTESVIRRYASPKIHYKKTPNTGAAGARNAGAAMAKGEYLIFLDSDDEVLPNWLESFNKKIEKGSPSILSCGVHMISDNGKKKKTVKLPSPRPLLDNINVLFLGGAFMIKKALFERVGGYDPKVKAGQHTELAFRLAKIIKAETLAVTQIQEPLVLVHTHSGAKIRTDHTAVFEGADYFIQKHGKELREKDEDIYFNYLSTAGVRGMLAGKNKDAKKYLRDAWRLKPFSLKALGRFLIAVSPLGKTFWSR